MHRSDDESGEREVAAGPDSLRPRLPGSPGEREVDHLGRAEQEFVAGALFYGGVTGIGPHTPDGPAAAALTVAVPAGQQPALDRLLADHERQPVELDIESRWAAMGMSPSEAEGPTTMIVRLDLLLTGPTLPTPVQTRILFGDVRNQTGVVLWAAFLTRRAVLFRERTFHQRALAQGDFEDKLSGGLDIQNLGGCDVLQTALETAGVTDDIFNGRHAYPVFGDISPN